MAKSGEQCLFCGWSRKTSWPSIRFYNIPKEPGLKKVRWLQAIADRKVTHRDRVCSVHFRSGRPSNDPSHEDFAPHMYLSSEPPQEVMHYLEQIADKDSECAKILAADASVEMIGQDGTLKADDSPEKDDRLLPLLPRKKGTCRPAIMQRKRRIFKEELIDENAGSTSASSVNDDIGPPKLKKVEVDAEEARSHSTTPSHSYESPSPTQRVARPIISDRVQRIVIGNKTRTAIPLDRYFADAAGIQAGQTLAIRCKKSAKRHNNHNHRHSPPNLSTITSIASRTTTMATHSQSSSMQMYAMMQNSDDAIDMAIAHEQAILQQHMLDMELPDQELLEGHSFMCAEQAQMMQDNGMMHAQNQLHGHAMIPHHHREEEHMMQQDELYHHHQIISQASHHLYEDDYFSS